MSKKKRLSGGAALSFADDLEAEAEAEVAPRKRKMRNPSIEGSESVCCKSAEAQAALSEAHAEEVTLALRIQNEVAGSSTLRLACTRGDTVDAVLARVAAKGSARETHGLILAIDHWIVPGTATLHWLLRRQWAEGGPMFVLDRDALSVMAASAFTAQKHLFPYQYWEELPAASVPRKYMGAWWQRVPQLNGRPARRYGCPSGRRVRGHLVCIVERKMKIKKKL